MSAADTTADPGPTPPTAHVEPAGRDAWVVLGMHRSGTSAMARVLELSGGQGPLDPLPPSAANVLGYFESASVRTLNDEILAKGENAWDDVFAGRPKPYLSRLDEPLRRRAGEVVERSFPAEGTLVLKDPRINVLGAFWDAALKARGFRPRYIIMVRHPMEVASSLQARDRMPLEHGLLLWLDHMLAAERDTRGGERAFVSYDALLQDWRGVLDDVERAWGQPLPRRTGLAGAEIAHFLQPGLRHQHAGRGLPPLRGSLGATVAQAYDWFTAATRPQPPAHRDALDQAAKWLDQLHEQLEPAITYRKLQAGELQAELDRYMAHVGALEDARERLEADLARSRTMLDAQAADASRLQAAIDLMAGERDEASRRSAVQAETMARVQAVLDLREADALQLRARLDARTVELQHARSALDGRSAELAQGQAALAVQVAELAAVTARQHAGSAEALSVRDAERDASLRRVRALEEEGARMAAELEAQRQAAQEVDALYRASLDTLRADYDRRLVELETLPASFEEELQASEARYGALSEEMRRVHGLADTAQAQRRELESELARARQAAAASQADGRRELEDQLGAVRESLRLETDRREMAEARAAHQGAELQALRSALSTARDETRALQDERRGMLNSKAWRLATASHRLLAGR